MARRPDTYDQSTSDQGRVRLVATLGTPRPGYHGEALAFSADGARVLALGSDSLCIYDAATGRFIGALELPAGDGPNAINEHGTMLVCGRANGNTGGVWSRSIADPGPPRCVLELPLAPVSVGVAPDGSWVAALDAEGTLTAGRTIGDGARAVTGPIHRQAQLCFSSDASRLAVREGSLVRVFSVPDGLVERTRRGLPRDEDVIFHPSGSRLRFRSDTFRFSRDGRSSARVVAAPRDRRLEVEIREGQRGSYVIDEVDLFEHAPSVGRVWDLAFHPHEDRIAVGLEWNQIHVRDGSGGCLWELAGPGGSVDWLCIDEAGNTIASLEPDPGDRADVLRIWDVPGARERVVLVAGEDRGMDLRRVLPTDKDPWEPRSTKQFLLSRDGARLACLTEDFHLNVFDTQDGRELHHCEVISLHDALVGFTPGGDIVYRDEHPMAEHRFRLGGPGRYGGGDAVPPETFAQSARTYYAPDAAPLEISFAGRTMTIQNVATGTSDTIALGSPPWGSTQFDRHVVVQGKDLALRVYALNAALAGGALQGGT